MSTDFSEVTLLEQPAIALFDELGYETANCFYEKVGDSGSTFGRETTEEVILVRKLRSAMEKLNPEPDSDAINLAIEALTRDPRGDELGAGESGGLQAAQGRREGGL